MIELKCIDCGDTFTAKIRTALRCPICKEKVRKQQHKEAAQRFRDNIKVSPIRRTAQPEKSITDVLRELNAYNKEHNTHLNYGQYILKVEGIKAYGKKR